MDPQITKEILDDLIPSLEALEAKSAAVLEFLKAEGIASDEKLAPYLEQAASASNVRWLGVRVRVERLLSSAEQKSEEKQTAKEEEKSETKQAKAADAKSDSSTTDNSQSAGPENPNESSPKDKKTETAADNSQPKSADADHPPAAANAPKKDEPSMDNSNPNGDKSKAVVKNEEQKVA